MKWLLLLLLLAGCSKSVEPPSSSVSQETARRAATAVAMLTKGKVCSVAPTGSMRPTFDANAFIVLEQTDISAVRVGDIVVRRDGERLIVHRVVRIEDGLPVTRGDANSSDDPGFVVRSSFEGRVVAVVYFDRLTVVNRALQ